MLGWTSARLNLLMEGRACQDGIFRYRPFNFGGSWIVLLPFLLRGSLITLNMDLTRIANDLPMIAPDYFLNVPQLLERMRRGVDDQLRQTGGIAQAVYSRAKAAWSRRKDGKAHAKTRDGLWLWLANKLGVSALRKKKTGGETKTRRFRS